MFAKYGNEVCNIELSTFFTIKGKRIIVADMVGWNFKSKQQAQLVFNTIVRQLYLAQLSLLDIDDLLEIHDVEDLLE